MTFFPPRSLARVFAIPVFLLVLVAGCKPGDGGAKGVPNSEMYKYSDIADPKRFEHFKKGLLYKYEPRECRDQFAQAVLKFSVKGQSSPEGNELLERAIDCGSNTANFYKALKLGWGLGVPKDIEKSISIFEELEEKRLPVAIFFAGVTYSDSNFERVDLWKARMKFVHAGQQDFPLGYWAAAMTAAVMAEQIAQINDDGSYDAAKSFRKMACSYLDDARRKGINREIPFTLNCG